MNLHTHTSNALYVYTIKCVYTGMQSYVCTYTCTIHRYICIYIYIYVYLYIRIYLHIHMYLLSIYTQISIYTYIYMLVDRQQNRLWLIVPQIVGTQTWIVSIQWGDPIYKGSYVYIYMGYIIYLWLLTPNYYMN